MVTGNKQQKSDRRHDLANADSGKHPAIRVHEVARPKLLMALAITYALWLVLLVWLACSTW